MDSESSVLETLPAETIPAETLPVDTVPAEVLSADAVTLPTAIVTAVPAAPVTPPPNPTVPTTVAKTTQAVLPTVRTVSPFPTPTDMVATAARSATFGPFLSLVESAGFTSELATGRPVTVFAPTESAFAALPPDVQAALRSPSNRDVLSRMSATA